jgi:HlyD family secretion protein
MQVETSVDEADIGKVKQDQRVEFTVDAYPDMKFEGTVSEVRLQPVTTNNVVTYVVILSAPNPDKKLMPGMTASSIIYVEEKQGTLTLSGKAVRFTPDTEYLKKMFTAMQKSGKMPKMPAGTMPTGMPAGQMTQGSLPAGMGMPGMQQDPKTKTVWVKDEKMGMSPRIIKIGIDNGSMVEVLTGLKEGDEVIISMESVSDKSAAAKTTNRGPEGPFPF